MEPWLNTEPAKALLADLIFDYLFGALQGRGLVLVWFPLERGEKRGERGGRSRRRRKGRGKEGSMGMGSRTPLCLAICYRIVMEHSHLLNRITTIEHVHGFRSVCGILLLFTGGKTDVDRASVPFSLRSLDREERGSGQGPKETCMISMVHGLGAQLNGQRAMLCTLQSCNR
jgi:hypothetical protein